MSYWTSRKDQHTQQNGLNPEQPRDRRRGFILYLCYHFLNLLALAPLFSNPAAGEGGCLYGSSQDNPFWTLNERLSQQIEQHTNESL